MCSIDAARAAALVLALAGGASARETVRRIEVPGGAIQIAFGAGAVWVTLLTERVARIDPSTNAVTILRPGRTPTGIAAGHGSVWVASGADGSVARIDPATSKITVTIDVGGDLDALGVVGGEIWVVADRGLVRIDPAANQRVGEPLLAGEQPYGFVVGFDSVWVSCVGKHEVVRIALADKKIVSRIPVGLAPGRLAILDGAVWVVNRKEDTISRIDPATNKVVGQLEAGTRPTAVAAHAGRLWITSFLDKGVMVLAPDGKSPPRAIPTGDQPAEIVAGGGALWVAHLGDTHVTRIDSDGTASR